MRRIIFFLTLLAVCSPSHAQTAGGRSTLAHISRAETAYANQDYGAALQWLRSMPDMIAIVPGVSSFSSGDRATIHLDIAACYLALGDTVRAFLNVETAYALKPRLREGHFASNRLRRFRSQLMGDRALVGQNRPKRAEATMKSLLFPGWGQFHLKRPERGFFFLGATVTAGFLYLTNRPPADPNNVPLGQVKKDHSKLYLAGFFGIYGLNVLDCIVLGANPSGVSLQIRIP